MNKHILIIYHKNCTDGFGAAWVLYDYFCNHNHGTYESISFMEADYGNKPPEVDNMDVYIVDFSYNRETLVEMSKKARSLTIIDHHKTAEEELRGLNGFKNIKTVFSMKKSGAMLSWEYFYGCKEPPHLLRLIQDRDLWKLEYENTKPALAALRSRPFDFEQWTTFMNNERAVKDVLVSEGYIIQRAETALIKELINNHEDNRWIELPLEIPTVTKIPILNCPGQFASEAGHLLCEKYKDAKFSMTYYDDIKAMKRVFSLRSNADNPKSWDVSKIAELFDGGGHKHSAGFKQSLPCAITLEYESKIL